MKLLHVGCANIYLEGFINSDMRSEWKGKPHKLDLVMDLGKPWPYEDASVDGIVGMHVFQQLPWRELVVCFREAFRVLKPGGVLRMGIPAVELMDKSLDWLLGWNNINLLSYDILENVLVYRIGFSSITKCEYRDSALPALVVADNRSTRGTHYIEVIK